MKIYDYKQLGGKLFFNGDIHGSFEELFHVIKSRHEGDFILVLLGDCGLGFNRPQYYTDVLNKINKWCEKRNIHIIMLRGNHDDPSYFDGETVNLSNIKAIPDYSVVMTNQGNILCVGGAISVDRTWRMNEERKINRFKGKSAYKKKLYWENESPVVNENLIQELNDNNITTIDIVATHARPSLYYPGVHVPGEKWSMVDDELKQDVENEQNVLNDVLINALKFKNNDDVMYWYNGHYHVYENQLSENEEIRFICLENGMSMFMHDAENFKHLDQIEWECLDMPI